MDGRGGPGERLVGELLLAARDESAQLAVGLAGVQDAPHLDGVCRWLSGAEELDAADYKLNASAAELRSERLESALRRSRLGDTRLQRIQSAKDAGFECSQLPCERDRGPVDRGARGEERDAEAPSQLDDGVGEHLLRDDHGDSVAFPGVAEGYRDDPTAKRELLAKQHDAVGTDAEYVVDVGDDDHFAHRLRVLRQMMWSELVARL
ncbi:hypothetical protein ACFPRL_09520 [Pseudoclavibacter helvolus]